MKTYTYLLFLASLYACTDRLNEKPNSSIVLPRTAADYRAILSHTTVMNVTPALAQLSADEYFIPGRTTYDGLTSVVTRNAYTWEKDIYAGETQVIDWRTPYAAIFYCNSVLALLDDRPDGGSAGFDDIRGWALFVRAYSHYALVSTFAVAYNEATAASTPGIPLRLSPDIDRYAPRSSVEDCYARIIEDVLQAIPLLEADIIPHSRNRPSRVAAHAFLARVYLGMGRYAAAGFHADRVLERYDRLIDYRTLDTNAVTDFGYNRNNGEVIYYSEQVATYQETTMSYMQPAYGVDTALLALYDVGDLRRPLYFGRNPIGNYGVKPVNSAGYPFTGIGTDEIYLIRAECLAREGKAHEAMQTLNTMLETRYSEGTFTPYGDSTPAEALRAVLTERRKSLVWRGLRWTDLKRLNREGANITLTRVLDGETFRLEPGDARYALPIPDDEIALSGIQQNER